MADSRDWTKEQKQVIRLRNRNILVSAAAGSGKTAVLVERILKKITDPVKPVDVDRLLVVTFTKAAAAEMRERIGNALERALEERCPEQAERLMKQATLLHSAQISTIDSFCKKIVEEHFHDIDLDPAFRVADEAELLLMRADVCEKLLEACYEENSPEFRDFAEMYASGRNDDSLEEMILQLYSFAESYPDPDQWLAAQAWEYREDPEQRRFDRVVQVLAAQMLQGAARLNEEALAVCRSTDGPFAYKEALLADQEWLAGMLQLTAGTESDAESGTEAERDFYGRLEKELSGLSFATLSRKKQEGIKEEKKEQVKSLRDQMKKVIRQMQEAFFFQSREEMQADYLHTVPGVMQLLSLTTEFRRRFQEKKRKNNLLDFSDLEHLAFRVLVDSEGMPTAAAAEYREFYEEILIDEYQDSNRIQELLLTSISREADGTPNRFMVGDVKQSIYKFRQARPELFMEKYQVYQKAETEDEERDCLYQRIDLHKNFRSRAEVLDVTNQVFRQIMHRSLGGVEYDEDAKLHLGAGYPELAPEERKKMQPEILLLETEDSEEETTWAGGMSSREKEALMIAERIKRLKKQGFACRDMVILLRTMSGWAETFLQILTSEGIPAVCETASGYFSAWEVQVMLNLLRVLDNPRQDIPLASVLLSPVGGMTAEELAKIRIEADRKPGGRDSGLYEALQTAARKLRKEEGEPEEEEEAFHKAAGFLSWLEEKRRQLVYTPVHEMVRQLLMETGFYRYASAMPAGRTRAANLSMLVQRAQNFEQTSYHGLFHFVRYIEKLHKYEVDYGEADAGSGEEDMVRIMSIHKSKGLEFPVVIVAGMAKPFNQQDVKSRVILHPDLGIAVDYVDLKLRQKAPTLAKRVLQKQLVRDNLGEELRVLYVAFTRAREKLILTGAVSGLERKLTKWREQVISDLSVMKAGNYLDLVMPVVLQDGTEKAESSAEKHPHRFRLQMFGMEDLAVREAEEQLWRMAGLEPGNGLHEKLPVNTENPAELSENPLWEKIAAELNWKYRYAAWQEMKGKITVTELKRLHLQEEEAGESFFPEEAVPPEHVIPDFAREEKKMAGTARGTLYHRIMEKLPLEQVQNETEFLAWLEQLQKKKQLTEEEHSALNARKFRRFLADPLAERMRQAQRAGKLHRESPFVLGLPASQVYTGLEIKGEAAGEIILVQGIIDAWLEEEDGLVLLDYKTDMVGEAEEQLLTSRYRIQLDYYRKALEQLTGKQVKEELIYSFSLGRSIRIPEL